MFELIRQDAAARRGRLSTVRGAVESPFFMPVATTGTLKSLCFEDIRDMPAQIVLSNTYHLYLRPGCEIIEKAGGLHKFISWEAPMLTDSGGYQVFSLTKLRKIKDDGVEFQSHLDGSRHFFTPEKVIDIQRVFGSDIMMPLDVCAPYPCGREEAEDSVRLTTAWAERSKARFDATADPARPQKLFGIIQGSTFEDLRRQSTQEILRCDFDGYAVGGVSVGEPVDEMFRALRRVVPHLPPDKPRYFMGIGLPDQIVRAVGLGVDMFDTCIPTRYGRHGSAFTRYGMLNLGNRQFKDDFRPIDSSCPSAASRKYSRAYIRHLLNVKELTALKLISQHNVCFYVNLMQDIRRAIEENRYAEFEAGFLKDYNSELCPN